MQEKPLPDMRLSSLENTKKQIQLDNILISLSAMKSENQVIIPLNGKSSLVDYMVIVNGTSDRHVRAIAGRLVSDLRDNGYGHYIPELGQDDAWVLLDLGEIIVHIFKQETRELYALEKMWSVSDIKKTHETISF
jgi:ribosome-associated protein